MKRTILVAFVAVAVIATAAIVYAVARSGTSRGEPLAVSSAPASASAAPGAQSAQGVQLGPAPALSADDLREVGLLQVKPGTRIIDFELTDLKGKKVKLSGFAGRIVFLNFWATWCPPCRAEMPSMERLHARLGDKGLAILGVDLQEARGDVEKFVREYKLSFPVVIDQSGSVAAAYGVRSIPTTYVIGPDGTILAGRIGGQEWDDPTIAAFFEKLLAR